MLTTRGNMLLTVRQLAKCLQVMILAGTDGNYQSVLTREAEKDPAARAERQRAGIANLAAGQVAAARSNDSRTRAAATAAFRSRQE